MISTNGLFQVGIDLLRTAVDAATHAVTAQVGDIIGEDVEGDDAEVWQHAGFASRPAPPSPKKKAAQALSFRIAGRHIVFATRDLRALPTDLADGETAVYAAGPDGSPAGRVVLRAGGSVHVEAGGGGATAVLDPAGDSITLTNAAGWGLAITPSGVTLTGPGGATLALTATGASLDGVLVQLGGAAAAIPAIGGPSGIAGLPSSKVLLAP